MPQTPGKCVFCGQGGLTRSHIWPEWSQKIVPSIANFYELVVGEPMQTFEQFTPGPDFFSKTKPGSAAKRQPRNTCLSCNGGWMREIEEAAKPTVADLMLGRNIILSTMNQRFLAAFLCLVSMRIELSSNMRAIPASDLEFLKLRREPPINWWICIAHYQETKDPHDYWLAYLGMRRAGLTEPNLIGPEHCNTQVTTIVAGKMCAHIFSSSVWNNFRGYEGAQMAQIWPANQFLIDMRGVRYIDNAGLPWLHEAVARDGQPPK